MRHEDQIQQGRKLLHHLATRTTAMADGVYHHNVSDYTCPEQAAAEREIFFRRGPINIGLSCLLPNPGDYMTHDYSGVPLLLVRQPDGELAGLLNVCRHRGARIAEGRGDQAKTFSCPYHGWTYGLDGQLLARADERSFAGAADKALCALRRIPVVEKYGMIWLSPTPGASFEVDDLLGGLGVDLAAYGLESYHHYGTRVLQRKLNWKGVVDTFLELYHLAVLHTETIHPILHTNLSTFDGFGPSLRLVGARRSIDRMRELPEDQWDVIKYSVIICVLFPNTVFVMQGDHLETWHVFPAGNGTDESVMYASLYTPEPAISDSARRHWDRNFDLLMATVDNEDFPLGEGIQRSYHSGAQDHVVFGRNEPALQHFHKSVKAALGTREKIAAE